MFFFSFKEVCTLPLKIRCWEPEARRPRYKTGEMGNGRTERTTGRRTGRDIDRERLRSSQRIETEPENRGTEKLRDRDRTRQNQ